MHCDTDLPTTPSITEPREPARDRARDSASAGRGGDFPLLLRSVVELLIDRIIESELRGGTPGPARDQAGAGR